MNALLVLAGIAMVAGYVWLLAVPFREHIAWGAFVLLLAPLGAVTFLATHPTEAWRPFALVVGALVLGMTLSYPASYEVDTNVDLSRASLSGTTTSAVDPGVVV